MDKQEAGILGAGIAGLSAAIALREAGFRVTVFEQAPAMEVVGVGLQVSPNASRLLRCLGLTEPLERVAARPESVDLCRWTDGRLLVRMPLGQDCVDRFGAPYYTLHRADLQRILREALAPDQVELGHRGVAVRPGAGSVSLRFADGTRRDVDLLVGADGLNSVARRVVASDVPRFSGLVAYRGLVDASAVPEFRDEHRVRGWFGPGRHCICYPVSAGRELSFTATVPADLEQAGARGETGLLAAFGGWDPRVLALLSSAEQLDRRPLHDRNPLPRWSTGRFTLAGDAAHPMLPFRAQGANQAIEDAVVLARCLHTQRGQVRAALASYERLRLPRTTRIQRDSRESARTFHLGDGARQSERDRDFSRQWSLAAHGWLFGYRAELEAA